MFNEFRFNTTVINGPDFYPETSTGGVVVGGISTPYKFIEEEGHGGVIVGGSGRIERRRRYIPIRTGIARNLNSDNIIKTAEADRLKKPTVTGRFALTTPTVTSAYTYQAYPGWCNVGVPCPGSGVVAAITVKNQNGYLPPQASSTVITNNMSQIAQLY